MPNPKINPSLAHDLSPAAVQLPDTQAEESRRIQLWRRVMRRSFKGILTEKERERFLVRSVRKIEEQIEEKEATNG